MWWTNYVQPGQVIPVTAPGAVAAGDPVLIGAVLFGVATHAALQNAALDLAVDGVFTLPADNNLEIDAGDRVFWVPGSSWVDKTANAQVCVGVAVAHKATTATTVDVRLCSSTAAGL